ncbi:MAG: VPLPA-CTERM sorting domain-containing protein [Pseudomonadota bacterium]
MGFDMRNLLLALACCFGLSAEAATLNISVTGRFDAPVGLDPNHILPPENAIFFADQPRVAYVAAGSPFFQTTRDALYFASSTGSMNVIDTFVGSEPELRVSNCTGLLQLLCGVRVVDYFGTLESWDYTFSDCLVDCNLDFNLRGYDLVTDEYFISVAFDTVVLTTGVTLNSEVSVVPLPAAGVLLLGAFGMLGVVRSRRQI